MQLLPSHGKFQHPPFAVCCKEEVNLLNSVAASPVTPHSSVFYRDDGGHTFIPKVIKFVSQAKPSQAKASQTKRSETKRSEAKRSQAIRSESKPSQAKPSQAKSKP